MSRVPWVLSAVLAVLVVIEFFFAPHHHPVFPWHKLTGHMAVIGLCSCLGVVVLSKWLGKLFLHRAEECDER
jgi:hypothetical protein